MNYMWESMKSRPIMQRNIRWKSLWSAVRSKKMQVTGLKEDIRKLGPVNVNAIEDFKELKERHTFLESQHTDLVNAAETLQGIIEELDTGMRRQFIAEKFQEIRVEFDKVFKQLFGGGKELWN